MPALLILAPHATSPDSATLAQMALTGAALQATPIIVAIPADVGAPADTRAVRVKRDVAAITAIRIGMAQLTNTTATSVLLWPLDAADVPLVSLLALLDAATRTPATIVAPTETVLDLAPVVVPRDAWLELVTLGEGGLGALAARRQIVRVDVSAGGAR